MMKTKIFLLLLLLSSLTMQSTFSAAEAQELKQCYCSDKCGPRDIGSKKDDAPFVDPETMIYFCQERDRQNYHKNKCHLSECPAQETDEEEVE